MAARFAPFFVGLGIDNRKLTRPFCVGYSGRLVSLIFESEAFFSVTKRAIFNHFSYKQGGSFPVQSPLPVRLLMRYRMSS